MEIKIKFKKKMLAGTHALILGTTRARWPERSKRPDQSVSLRFLLGGKYIFQQCLFSDIRKPHVLHLTVASGYVPIS